MREVLPLLMVTTGLVLIWAAFRTPPDPRGLLADFLGGRVA